MNAIERRAIKGKLLDKLASEGYSVHCTDSSYIAMFTDKPINKSSSFLRKGLNEPYLTSFGPVTALKYLDRK